MSYLTRQLLNPEFQSFLVSLLPDGDPSPEPLLLEISYLSSLSFKTRNVKGRSGVLLFYSMAKVEEEEKTSFTVDSERSNATTMPSVNRLLNRKSMDLTKRIKIPTADTKTHSKNHTGPLPGAEAPATPILAANPIVLESPPADVETPPPSKSEITLAPPTVDTPDAPPDPTSMTSAGTLMVDFNHSGSKSSYDPPPPPSAPPAFELGSPSPSSSPVEQGYAPPPPELPLSAPEMPSEPPPPIRASSGPSDPPPNFDPTIALPALHKGVAPGYESTYLMSPAEALSKNSEEYLNPQEGRDPLPTRAPKAQLRVNPSHRKTAKPQKLATWDMNVLKQGHDPLGHGIYVLMQQGAKSVLFLSISPPPPGSPVPHFLSAATVSPHHKLNVWTGLKWDPTVVPEMWNHFIKMGQVELTPPGLLTNQKSNRNVVRAAFGILENEWLLLIRAGPAEACRGVVAFVSNKSILTEAPAALSLLQSQYPLPEPK